MRREQQNVDTWTRGSEVDKTSIFQKNGNVIKKYNYFGWIEITGSQNEQDKNKQKPNKMHLSLWCPVNFKHLEYTF